MEYNCQNCNLTFSENFCGYCGQKKYKRIDKKYLWDEIQYTLLHTNKGFLYSVKSIIRNPGKTAQEFINGNRVNHYKPIGLAFILSSISAFISFKIIKLNDIYINGLSQSNQGMNNNFMNDYMSSVSSYNSLIMILFIPIIALFSCLLFKKSGNNYYEHVIMNAYGVSFYTIVCILFIYPLMFIVKENAVLTIQISQLLMLTIPIMMIWFYKNYYPHKSLKSILARVMVIVALLIILFIVLVILGVIIYIMIKGPEAMGITIPKK